MRRLLVSWALGTSLLAAVVQASLPISSLQVTLRGKKYDVADVTTVQDIQEQVSQASGIPSEHQGRIIFGGKKLSASDVLSEAGVADGAHLNMVPSTLKPKKSGARISTTTTTTTSTAAATASASAASTSDAVSAMQDYLKQAGVDPSKLDEMMQNLNPNGGSPPSMEESLKMMNTMMKSPIFDQFMSDPTKLEESRQMILNNPLLKSMMAGMPGMGDILNDPDAWREAMQAAVSFYKSMDNDQLLQMMQNGMGGGMPGGMSPSLFDGTLDSNSAAALALDELDEDD